MNSLIKLQEESELMKKEIESLREEEREHENRIKMIRTDIEPLERFLYEKNIKILHIKEIYRAAKQQFSRLRNQPEPTLTEADIAELEKWIGRCKSNQSLFDIIEALQELNKYLPHDIKSNLYALVQKIIIGGAYKTERGKA